MISFDSDIHHIEMPVDGGSCKVTSIDETTFQDKVCAIHKLRIPKLHLKILRNYCNVTFLKWPYVMHASENQELHQLLLTQYYSH